METEVIPSRKHSTSRRRKRRRAARLRLVLLAVAVVIVLAAAVTLIVSAINRANAVEMYVPLTAEEIQTVLDANGELDSDVETVVNSAVSLVGRLNYFWGGKSSAVGWDDRWGEPTLVTSEGSASYGTERPYGMDCSGFVSWCFIQLGLTPAEMEAQVGNGTWNQWDRTSQIAWGDLRVGDFVFQRSYPTSEGNHIGICVGFIDGEPVFAHLAAGFDNVVVTRAGDVFTVARRPNFFAD